MEDKFSSFSKNFAERCALYTMFSVKSWLKFEHRTDLGRFSGFRKGLNCLWTLESEADALISQLESRTGKDASIVESAGKHLQAYRIRTTDWVMHPGTLNWGRLSKTIEPALCATRRRLFEFCRVAFISMLINPPDLHCRRSLTKAGILRTRLASLLSRGSQSTDCGNNFGCSGGNGER